MLLRIYRAMRKQTLFFFSVVLFNCFAFLIRVEVLGGSYWLWPGYTPAGEVLEER
jgi:hypothetical protein